MGNSDYVIVDVTDVIHKDRRAKVEFASENVRIGVHVYKRSESMLCTLRQRQAHDALI